MGFAQATRIFCSVIPNSASGHLAYGSFLNDIGEEKAAMLQNEKAIELDPKDPAAWNNLANYYVENGALTNAFINYTKAIELNPTESVYYEKFRDGGLSLSEGRKGVLPHQRATGF